MLRFNQWLTEGTVSCAVCGEPVFVNNKPVDASVVQHKVYDRSTGDLDFIELAHRACALRDGWDRKGWLTEDATEQRYFLWSFVTAKQSIGGRAVRLGRGMQAPVELTLTDKVTGNTRVVQTTERGAKAIWQSVVRRGTIQEDAPANAAGGGAVAGIGIGPQGEPGVDLRKKRKRDDEDDDEPLQEAVQPDGSFAGADVFRVDTDRFLKSRFGKNRYHRYARYVGEDEVGQAIRSHGRTTKRDIVLQDGTTGAMIFFRRKRTT